MELMETDDDNQERILQEDMLINNAVTKFRNKLDETSKNDIETANSLFLYLQYAVLRNGAIYQWNFQCLTCCSDCLIFHKTQIFTKHVSASTNMSINISTAIAALSSLHSTGPKSVEIHFVFLMEFRPDFDENSLFTSGRVQCIIFLNK